MCLGIFDFCREREHMGNRVVLELYPGETLFVELEVFDDEDNLIDLTSAQPSVKSSPAIDDSNLVFGLTGLASGVLTARIDGAYTQFFPVGDHEFQIWLRYPNEDVEDEVILDAMLHVKKERAV